MTHQEYKVLVRELIGALVEGTPTLRPSQIAGGRSNTVIGASGFAHQIDVSLRTDSCLVLVECKLWAEAVDAEPVLVLTARLADIRDANPSLDIRASLVSTKAATAGAITLAKYFGVSIDVVSGMKEYALRLRDQVFVTFSEGLNLGDNWDAEVTRGVG